MTRPVLHSKGNAVPSAQQLWVSALDANLPAGKDPSHPAFYLPGQDVTTGNHRAFASLDACLADGDPCSAGTDCCNGYCTNGVCGRQDTVPGNPPACSQEQDKCSSNADCCPGLNLTCIGGYCSFIAPQ